MPNFKDLRMVDNFYQTSSFFPMPTILVSTIDDEGETSIGSYSLCFPYYVAGKDYYAMILECRNNSNTAQHLLKRPYCALNFIPSKKSYFKEAVRLGFPGDSSKEKMANLAYHLEDSRMKGQRPKIVSEAFQVFECTWVSDLDNAYKDKTGQMEGYKPPYRNFNGITSEYGAHFILKIDKILMEDTYYQAIIDGVSKRSFPQIPVDYGYRDNTHFWYATSKRYISEPVPAPKDIDISTVRYAADRTDPNIHFTDEACKRLTKVPRIFLKAALNGCVKWAKENGIREIGEEEMDIIHDKRRQEKHK